MVALSGLLFVSVSVRLGLVMSTPRTSLTRDGDELVGEHDQVQSERRSHQQRIHHRRHHARHRPRGVLPPPHAEVRCYCNLPACVTTGLVCQSMVGSCFSETTQSDGVAARRHGCLELLSRHKQHICERLHSANQPDGRLRCCTDDMCNLMDDVDFQPPVTNTRIPAAARELPTPPPELLSRADRQAAHSGELWLRAATIAVPIAGLFILCLLVVLAVRLLRRESKPPPYQYAKAPLCAPEPVAERPTAAPPATDGGRLVAPPGGATAAPTATDAGRLLAPPGRPACVDVHRAECCGQAFGGGGGGRDARCSCGPVPV